MAETKSAIYLALQFEAERLKKIIDRQLDEGLLQAGQSPDDKRMQVELSKCGSVQLQLASNRIKYRIPLQIRLTYDAGLTKLYSNAKIELDFETAYTIDEGWTLKTKTELLKHRWIEAPRIKVAGLDIPAASIADFVIRRAENSVEKTIDRLVSEQIDLKARLAEAWNTLRQPIIIHHFIEPIIYLNVDGLGISKLLEKHGHLTTQFALKGKPEVHLGKPEFTVHPAPLPKFEFLDFNPGVSQISSVIAVPYAHLQKMAQQYLNGNRYQLNEAISIVIDQILIAQVQGLLFIKVSVSGSFSGAIRLSGTPHYDPVHDRLSMQQLEIKVETKNLLHRAAAWAAAGIIKKQFQAQIHEQSRASLETVKRDLEKQLNTISLLNTFDLRVEIKQLKLTDVVLQDRDIHLHANLQGYVGLLPTRQ